MLVRLWCVVFALFVFATACEALRPSRVAPSSTRSASSALSMAKFCLSVKLCINPSRRDEFLKCIKDNAKGTRTKEPLNLGYTWGESTTTPNTFHFQEQFASKEGFENHTKMPHFLEWEKFASSPGAFSAPPVLDFFEEAE